MAIDVASGLIRMKLRETILVAERVSYIMETHPSRLVNLALPTQEGPAARELAAALNDWDCAFHLEILLEDHADEEVEMASAEVAEGTELGRLATRVAAYALDLVPDARGVLRVVATRVRRKPQIECARDEPLRVVAGGVVRRARDLAYLQLAHGVAVEREQIRDGVACETAHGRHDSEFEEGAEEPRC